LILEYHNPARLTRLIEMAGGTSAAVVGDRGDDLMIDRVTYDQRDRRSRTERIVVRDGRVRRLEFTLEQVPAGALEPRLRTAGFSAVELYGRGEAPFEPLGPRLIAVAVR
jgi:hypothetical protein